MVSFSCDKCQNVLTKPKVLRHLSGCRTETVSCIDCGVVFDRRSVRKHTSCISEAEKYAPKNKSSTECTQTFCGKCKLALNGAVHALQHYESKKHRAAERKLKEAEKKKKEETKAPASDSEKESAAQNGAVDKSVTEHRGSEKREKKEKQQKPLGIKKAMKKILKKAPKQKLKRDGLISQITLLLGKKSPSNLPELVDMKANKSAQFKVRNGRISLITSGDS